MSGKENKQNSKLSNDKFGNYSFCSTIFCLIYLFVWLRFQKTKITKLRSTENMKTREQLRNRLNMKLQIMALKQKGQLRLKLLEKLLKRKKNRKRFGNTKLASKVSLRNLKYCGQVDLKVARDREREATTKSTQLDEEAFDERINKFLQHTDVLSLHKCSLMLFEPCKQQKLSQIQTDTQTAKETLEAWVN